MSHVTRDKWHVTCDKWHVTRDKWHVNILSKFQVPSSSGLEMKVSWRFGGKGSLNEWLNELMTEVFVEKPRQHRVY